MPWLTKNKKDKSDVLHPIFAELAELTDDPFWKQTLLKASQGKFPSGFSCKGGNLTYKKGTKLFKVALEDNTAEALTLALDFFRERGGIRSAADRERENRNEQPTLSFYDMTWADTAKNKNLQSLLLNSYAKQLASKYDLDRNEVLTHINIGISLGYIPNEGIVLTNGNICSMHGLIVRPGHVSIDIGTKRRKKATTKPTVSTKKLNYLASWYKFLDSLMKGGTYSYSMAREDTEE